MTGEIISDLSSARVGGPGCAPSEQTGIEVPGFEVVQHSDPGYMGKKFIKPALLMLTGAMRLRRLQEIEAT
jgi:isocitrate dehydrogenase